MPRRPGLSARVKLTLSYLGFLMVAGAVLLAVVWVFLLRYVPAGQIDANGPFVPNRGDLVRAFVPAAAWALAFLVLFGLVGGWFLAGRMLEPLARITAATRRASAGSLAHRIELEGRQDEFRELADSFDAMLGRLEAQVDEQRRFAANASHELRTPLAITQALIDVARDDPERDVDALLTQLRAVNTRAVDLTEALLLLSRVERGTFVRDTVDLSLTAEQAAEDLLPLAERAGVSIEVDAQAAPVVGSPALLGQMTANLLQNAIVHNLPGGGTVHVSTKAIGGVTVLRIENTGEPVGEAVIATLTEPFQRGTERARGGHPGVGLGLAIVASIVQAHDGELILRAGSRGGLNVEVRLPAS